MRIILIGLGFLLAACSPETKVEDSTAATALSPDEDHTQEYLAAVQGVWGGCVGFDRFEELQLTTTGFARRIIVFKRNLDSTARCKPGDEIFEVRTSGTYEIKDDRNGDPDFDIFYHNQNVELNYYDNEEAFLANGIGPTTPSNVIPVCTEQRFKLGQYDSMIGDSCRYPYNPYYTELYPIVTFDSRGKLRVDGEKLMIDPTSFGSDIRDLSSEPSFVFDSMNRREEAYKVAGDYEVFSDLDRLKAAVQGSWHQCLDGYNEVVITFGPSEFTKTVTEYSGEYGGDGCDGIAKFVEEYRGHYEILGFDALMPGSFRIDWHVEERTQKPLTADKVDLMNATGIYSSIPPFCQDVTFTMDVASSIIGKSCRGGDLVYETVTANSMYDRLLLHRNGRMHHAGAEEGEGVTADQRVSRVFFSSWYEKYSSGL